MDDVNLHALKSFNSFVYTNKITKIIWIREINKKLLYNKILLRIIIVIIFTVITKTYEVNHFNRVRKCSVDYNLFLSTFILWFHFNINPSMTRNLLIFLGALSFFFFFCNVNGEHKKQHEIQKRPRQNEQHKLLHSALWRVKCTLLIIYTKLLKIRTNGFFFFFILYTFAYLHVN